MTEQPRQPGLAAALAALQAEIPLVAKTKTGEIKGTYKTGPQAGQQFKYSYKYADLADISAAVMPLMGRHGLSFTCQPTLRDDGKFGLAYQLLHASGELIDGWYPLDPTMTPQQIGGHITYARRYCLCAITGIAAEEDTDAREAEAAAQKQPRGRAPQRAAGALPRNDDGSVARSKVTDAELNATGNMTDAGKRQHNRLEREVLGVNSKGRINDGTEVERLPETPPDDPWQLPEPVRTPHAAGDPAQAIAVHFTRFGVTDRDVRLGMISALIGRPIKSSKELTAYEGLALKRALGKCRDADAFRDFFDHEADAFRADISERRKETANA